MTPLFLQSAISFSKLLSITDVLAMFIAFLALVLSLFQFVRNESRQKKEATLNAYCELQEKVFTPLNAFIKPYADDEQQLYTLDVNDSQWDDITTWLVLIERFSVGINTGVFSIRILNRIGGGYFIRVFNTLKPIIDRKRFNNTSKGRHYDEFELTVKQLQRLRRFHLNAL